MNGRKKTMKLGFALDGEEWYITLNSGDGDEKKKKCSELPALFCLAIAASAIARREGDYKTQLMTSMYCMQKGKMSGVYLAPVVGVSGSVLVRCDDCCVIIPLTDVKEMVLIFLEGDKEKYMRYVKSSIRMIEGELNEFATVAPTNYVGVKPATDESIRKFFEENGVVE